MRLSKCVFFIKEEDKIIAYNNLNFKVLEIDHAMYKNMRDEDVETRLNPDELEYLINNRFIVQDNYNEIKARQNIKNNIKEKSNRDGSSSVSFIRISLTENCNLRCKYCFVNKIVNDKKNISEQLFIEAINYLIDNNVQPRVQYFGGEPLLRMELICLGHKMLEKAKQDARIQGFNEEIVTNGTLLTEDKIEFFINNNISLIFSLDGWRDINDKNRIDEKGNGTFEFVIKNIMSFKKKGGNAGIILTPNKDNIAELDNIVESFIRDYDIRSISINAPQPNNDGWNIDGKLLAKKTINIYQYCEKKDVNISIPGMNLIHNLMFKKYQIFSCSNYGGVINKRWGIYLFSNGEMSYCLVERTPESMDKFKQFQIGDKIDNWHLQCNDEECSACIAYSVCGGMCSMERRLISNFSSLQNKCIFNREILKWGLTR